MKIERFAYTPFGVFGEISAGSFKCYCVERPWINNEPSVSCIPCGEYAIQLGRYNRGGYKAYEIMNVPGRSLIKIHKGNTMDDLMGCVAPGMSLGFVGGKWAVINSRDAFARLMKEASGDTTINITRRQWQYHS